ncbi:MATE family efflux transporter [Frigidibacter sp. MR17.24]|uniref:MATE family efflux transporter n=1 Tax=Frigidibacter sp. MR17.24 TaxID=3127345 RepID=UPI003012D727
MTASPRTFSHHLRATIRLALPLAGSQLAHFAMHVTDTVMLGWYGVGALAAGVLGASSYFILFILGSGFAAAAMGMVASAMARDDETQVRRDVRMGIWLSLIYACVVYPVFYFSESILRALGQEPALAAAAADYLRIIGIGLIPSLVVMVLRSFAAALERVSIVLWSTVAAAGVNAVLNWALIFGNWGAPELGLRGAAMATVGSQLISLTVVGGFAYWHPAMRRFRLFQRLWRPDWPVFLHLARRGLPVGLTNVAEGSLFSATAMMMGWIGTVELAAHGIALEAAALTFMIHIGIGNAATVRVGRFHGLGDLASMRRAGVAAIAVSMAVSAFVIAVFLVMPGTIVGLFVDHHDPAAAAIIAFGTTLLAVAAMFQLFDAQQALALALLRGVQDTAVPMWIATFSYWVIGIPVAYLLAFPLGLGGIGLWFGLVCGLGCAGVLLMVRFWLGPARREAAPEGALARG